MYLNPALISHCSSVQGRMAGASTNVYEFDSMVRSQHVHKSVWTSPGPEECLHNWSSQT